MVYLADLAAGRVDSLALAAAACALVSAIMGATTLLLSGILTSSTFAFNMLQWWQGDLLGMLLVRGYDRSERIMAAMKCRGFQGRFYLLDHFSFQSRDLYFSLASVLLLLTMLAAEFLWPNL